MDAASDLTSVQSDEVNLPELWRQIQEVRTRIPTIPFPMIDVGIDEGTGTSPERKSNSLLAPPPASASVTGFPRLVVVQPTPTCNIDCKYCYLPGRRLYRRMSFETVRGMNRFFLAGNPNPELRFLWHCGEPLLVSPSFYETAFGVSRDAAPPGCDVRQSIQTNGTLIDERWCDLFIKWDVEVGISVDGPKNLHDANRLDRNGRGTFDRVMSGIQRLKEREIPFSVICVLSADAFDHPDAVWGFMGELGARAVSLNIEQSLGQHRAVGAKETSSLLPRFLRFFRRIMELEDGSTSRVFIHDTQFLRDLIQLGDRDAVRPCTTPLEIVTVNWKGQLSTFSPELLDMVDANGEGFLLGSVEETRRPIDLTKGARFKQIDDAIRTGISRCSKECAVYPICGGGSPASKMSENGDFASTETTWCRLMVQALGKVALEAVERRSRDGLASEGSVN